MKAISKLAAILSLMAPVTVSGGHPLLTEDTGTQGAGRHQLELTYDSNHRNDPDTKTREQGVNAVLSMGVLENLDFIVTLHYGRVAERKGDTSTTAEGIGDAEIAVKWRFLEGEALSFALRPALILPTGDEGKGLGAGHVIPSLFGVMTYAIDPWSFHLHLGYTRNFHDGADERARIYASVAAEYGISETLRLVGDASIESNAERSGHPNAGSMVLGLVYAVTPDLDIDLGYRIGLTDATPDYSWLAGLALRF